MARPRKRIDVEVLKKLAERQWPDTEIAAFFCRESNNFKISHQTIRRRYGQIIDTCRLNGKSKLRDQMWIRLQAGSDVILKHAMQHYLEQHEKVDVNQSIEQVVSKASDETLRARIAKIREDV
jgi:hypothetical protein